MQNLLNIYGDSIHSWLEEDGGNRLLETSQSCWPLPIVILKLIRHDPSGGPEAGHSLQGDWSNNYGSDGTLVIMEPPWPRRFIVYLGCSPDYPEMVLTILCRLHQCSKQLWPTSSLQLHRHVCYLFLWGKNTAMVCKIPVYVYFFISDSVCFVKKALLML